MWLTSTLASFNGLVTGKDRTSKINNGLPSFSSVTHRILTLSCRKQCIKNKIERPSGWMQFLYVRHFTIFSTFHNHNAWVLPQYKKNVSFKNINLARESKLLNFHNVAELGQCSPTVYSTTWHWGKALVTSTWLQDLLNSIRTLMSQELALYFEKQNWPMFPQHRDPVH